MPAEKIDLAIPPEYKGKRIDQALAGLLPRHSRARIQSWIRAGSVRINSRPVQQSLRLEGGENVVVEADYPARDEHWSRDPIPLDLIYEDDQLIVLNKPSGLVVHPGAGNRDHTLANALLYRFPELESVPRAGIVQRLDKETTGLMVVARTPIAHTRLVDQLQKREIKREYTAVVAGTLTAGGTVDAPIGRHKIQRKRMAVTDSGKPAVTHYRIIKKFPAHTLIRLQLESGRTHQIRVHMAHIRHPVVGDPLYGGRPRFPKGASESLRQSLQAFPRQALHASKLTLRHPTTGEEMCWAAPLPEDMQGLIAALEAHGN